MLQTATNAVPSMKQIQAVKQSKDGQSDASEKNSFGEVLATKKQNQAQSSASCQKDAKANKKNQAESRSETEGSINAEVLPNMTVSDGSPPATIAASILAVATGVTSIGSAESANNSGQNENAPSGVTASFTTAAAISPLTQSATQSDVQQNLQISAQEPAISESMQSVGEQKSVLPANASVQNVPEQSGKKFDFAESASVSSQKNADAAAKAQSGSVIQENGTGTETAMTQSQPHESHAIDVLKGVIAKQSDSDENHTDGDATQKHSIAVLENNIQRMSSGMQTIKVSDSSNEIGKSVGTQVIDQIKTNLSADNSEFTMQLTPKDLGELTVKMTAKDGVLTIELTAADPKTQHLLNQKAGEIQSAIQSSQDKQVQISCPTHHQTQNQDLFKQSDSHARQQQQQSRQNEEENQAFASTESFLNMLQQMDLVAV